VAYLKFGSLHGAVSGEALPHLQHRPLVQKGVVTREVADVPDNASSSLSLEMSSVPLESLPSPGPSLSLESGRGTCMM
jgi:hypothetical protein